MIKNMKWMISAILILCGTMTAQAAQDEKNGTPFFTSEDLPNIANFLPAPPEFESAAFVYDQTQHLWGKLQRLNEERAQMAINDAVFGMQPVSPPHCSISNCRATNDSSNRWPKPVRSSRKRPVARPESMLPIHSLQQQVKA